LITITSWTLAALTIARGELALAISGRGTTLSIWGTAALTTISVARRELALRLHSSIELFAGWDVNLLH
jgi:hypothetical protein